MTCHIESRLLVIISMVMVGRFASSADVQDVEHDEFGAPNVIRSFCSTPRGADRFGLGRFLGDSFGEVYSESDGRTVMTNRQEQGRLVVVRRLRERYEGFDEGFFSYDTKRRLYRVELWRDVSADENAMIVMNKVLKIKECLSRRYGAEFHKEIPASGELRGESGCIYRFVNADDDFLIAISLFRDGNTKRLCVSVQSEAVLRSTERSCEKEHKSTAEPIPSVNVEVDI